jgi:hypothetical protein
VNAAAWALLGGMATATVPVPSPRLEARRGCVGFSVARPHSGRSPRLGQKQKKLIVRLPPVRVRGFDNHRVIGRGLRLYVRRRETLPLPRSWF